MKRPEEVWLAGTRWTIQWVDVLQDGDNGITTDSDRLIRIAAPKGVDESFLRQVAIHEITHAAVFAVGGHWPSEEEHGVRLLERPMLSLFDDERNKPLRKWLCAGSQ